MSEINLTNLNRLLKVGHGFLGGSGIHDANTKVIVNKNAKDVLLNRIKETNLKNRIVYVDDLPSIQKGGNEYYIMPTYAF